MPRSILSAWPALLTGFLLPSCGEKTRDSPRVPEPAAPAPVSYNFEIRPILAANCFGCHGPNGKDNKSALRLDSAEFAFRPLGEEGDDLHAWVPGDRTKSLGWTRLHSPDYGGHPPAPDPDHQLPRSQRELLGRWIDEGAHYEPPWALQPIPPRVPLPDIADHDWAKNDLDHFILAKIVRDGSEPAPQADPSVLLRRFSLALTGLPPTLEELQAFRRASAAGAIPLDSLLATTSDRLLASPDFGENLASLWLETAGYADPVAPHSDELTNRWLYRDWVVEAFNNNLPYDQFLTAQIAGDLTEGTSDLGLATAFLRLHPLATGPEVTSAEARQENCVARAVHLASAILARELECARCHDHKSDALPRNDVTTLAAFFHSTLENGLSQPGITPAPTQARPTREQFEQLRQLQTAADHAERRAQTVTDEDEAMFKSWLEEPLRTTVINDAVGIFSFDENTRTIPNHALNGAGTGEATGLKFTGGFSGGALTFDGTAGATFSGVMPLHRWTPWTFTLRFRAARLADEPVVLLSRGRGAIDQLRGLDLLLENGHLTARIAREWPGNALAIRTALPVVAPGHWHLLSWTYDGSSSAEGMRLCLDGKQTATEVVADSLWKLCFFEEDRDLPLQLGWRQDARGFAGGAVDEFQVHSRALTALELATLYDGVALPEALAKTGENLPALRNYYLSSIYSSARALRQQSVLARQASILPEEAVLEVSVMKGLPHSPPTALPAFLERQSSDLNFAAAPTRADLAAAILHHPLTARVFVNRIWKHFFGRGLVPSADNFGLSGEIPSHPQLLDWLARDFIDHGWDVKRLCKQIVLSATFGQDSRPREGAESGMPLFAGGPSFALSAARSRDFVLHAGGLLDDQSGGPPVSRDAQPPRRSLYSIQPYAPPRPTRPANSPDGEAQCPIDYHQPRAAAKEPSLTERERQQACQGIAGALLRATPGEEDRARCQSLALLLTGKPFAESRLVRFLEVLNEQRAGLSGDQPSPRPPVPHRFEDLDLTELSAWSAALEDELIRNPLVPR